MNRYHDEEWGVPLYDDRKLFEFLLLDSFQAGLSWRTILYRREGFRRAFDDFRPEVVAVYTLADVERLLSDPGIIRNRQKVDAAIANARRTLEVQREHGSLAAYLWQFTGGRTLRNASGVTPSTIPTTSPESDAMSKALRMRGFTFVGSTIMYAFMQSAGMVNDHVDGCFRVPELARLSGTMAS
jgi:DNA-3-methyladenine glycosylase I